MQTVVSNVNVYGFSESVKASKYPMATEIVDHDYTTQCLEAYPDIVNIWDKIKELDDVEMFDDYFSFKLKGNRVMLSYDDYDIGCQNLYISGNYVKIGKDNIHKLIMNNTKDYVDHINRDTFDNRRTNLRACSPQENNWNSNVYRNNSSGVMGVMWDKQRNKWRAFISPNNKQVFLGRFDCIEDAIRARLVAEKENYGEFSPQRHLFSKYDIESENYLIEHRKPSAVVALNFYRRSKSLSGVSVGSAHDNFLRGIIVQFDLTFTNKAWVEAERYTFFNIVSSQSTMHRIAKFDLDKAYIEHVHPESIELMKRLIKEYNDEPSEKKYLQILYTNPAGFRLTARISTNYQQLKTIYFQRRNHRLPEWQEFCDWVETLPYFQDWILKGK